MRTRVKICGITNVEDALFAAECGADAIGLVFARSPRQVEPGIAAGIVRALPPYVCAVGVFVDAQLESVKAIARAVGLHAVQLHGSENAAYAAELGPLEVIKGIRVASAEDIRAADNFPGHGILLDSFSAKAAGGTGEIFFWDYARDIAAKRPIILAGGLRVENVLDAIRAVKPWGVDVSSGVESAPGRKDRAKVAEFIRIAQGPR